MRIATILVTLALLVLRVQGAASAINGELFVAAGTSGTNALPTSRTTNVTINATSKAADGTAAYAFDTSLAHTFGDLLEFKNNGSLTFNFKAEGGFEVLDPAGNEQGITVFSGFQPNTYQTLAPFYFITTISNVDVLKLEPGKADGSTPYKFDTSVAHTSGNLFELDNNGTLKTSIDYNGLISTYALAASNGSDAANYYPSLAELVSPNPEGGSNIGALQSADADFKFQLSTSAGGGTNYVLFQPKVAASTTPYYLNSGVAHTSGNLLEIANRSTNALVLDYNGGLTLGRTAAQGSITLSDSDGSNTHRRVAASAITTDINEIGPGAPFNGIPYYTISSTTNFTMAGVTIGSGLSLVAGTLSATGGSGGGNLQNTGTPVVRNIPAYSDTTGTNVGPATAILITGTNDTTIITANAGSITGSGATGFESHTGTWNTSGNPTGFLWNITNTASGSTALLADFQTDNTTRFKISKAGLLTAASSILASGGGNDVGALTSSGLSINNRGSLTAASDGNWIIRDAAATGFNALILGPTDGTANNATIQGNTASGTDIAAGGIAYQGGASTGTGRGGYVQLRTSPSGSTGSTTNASQTRLFVPAKAVTLTESSATTVATIACATGNYVGCNAIITVYATDATDFQARTLNIPIAAVNKAGTVTGGVGTAVEAVAVSTGTLTATITAVANGNAVDIKVNAVSSLTQTTLQATLVIDGINSNGTAAVTEI